MISVGGQRIDVTERGCSGSQPHFTAISTLVPIDRQTVFVSTKHDRGMRSIARTDNRTNGDYPFDMYRWRIWKRPLRCGQCRLAKLSLSYLVGRF